MTADTAIERFDALFPNALPYGEKLNMLSVLDGRIYKEILSRYEGIVVFILLGYKYGDKCV